MAAEAPSSSCQLYCDVTIPFPGVKLWALNFDLCLCFDLQDCQNHISMSGMQPLASFAISTLCLGASGLVRCAIVLRPPDATSLERDKGQGGKSIPDIDGEGIRGGDFPALGL